MPERAVPQSAGPGLVDAGSGSGAEPAESGPGSGPEPADSGPEPEPEPAASGPGPEPVASGPGPEPVASGPGPEPASPGPGPEPAGYGPEPADSGPRPGPGPEPAGSRPEPGPRSADPGPRPRPEPALPPPTRPGIAGLSFRYQVVAALALAIVAVGACFHLAMVFLHVAPANTVSKQHGALVDDWVYPEFEQNWKLFAPNPLQQNIAVQARAELRTPDGELRQTRWYDLSAQDGAAIDGNLLPSHTQQNELRRAWDVYVGTHDAQDRPTGLRGTLSEQYLRRILVLRLARLDVGGGKDVMERVQVRSRSTTIEPPKWSDEKVNQKPLYRQVAWWTVTSHDAPLDSGTRVRVLAPTAGGAR
ncbi:DUF5819 family protein [Streptomyces longispororuber]|uniref:DUF5819 family protein n=1 Tax=Streptomyces longispororuber TaxID=68230 RepID=UPI00210A67BB|nr:DUF5819 family protein [Streptomyces longispororuber]MCQ4209228.1 DUF5819 family protein [Streptomyces longispororuber]